MNKKRAVVFLLVLLILGSGVGFVTVVLPAWRGSASPLQIEEQKDAAAAESGVKGHRDLRFRNQTNKPLKLHLERSDCECAHLQVCVTPDEWKELDSQAFLKHATEPTLAWQTLERSGQPFLIPPRSHGLIRVAWRAFKVGASSIGIDLRVDDGQKEIPQHLETRVNVAEPVLLRSEGDPNATEIDIGRLQPGEERTARFLCYSITRDEFTLTPAPPENDPCIRYGSPEPLTSEELRTLSQKASAQVRAGYRVKITVREQADDHRLDLGPFHRRIVYKTDVYEDLRLNAYVNGTVMGEITLADSEGKDSIDFDTITPSDPKPVTFTLDSRDPQIQLSVDEERTIPFLKIELLDGKEGKPAEKGKRWQVRALFRKDALFRGEFPNPTRPGYDSADSCSLVFLLSRPGQSPSKERRLFVPVRGKVRFY
jgi:hypothetical protein